MTHRTKHEIKLQVQELLSQINQALVDFESPKVEVNEDGLGVVSHPRCTYLGSVKEICEALIVDEKTAEIIISLSAV